MKHTKQELNKQKELDKGFIIRYKKLSLESQKRYKNDFEYIKKRIKDNYKGYMKEEFKRVYI